MSSERLLLPCEIEGVLVPKIERLGRKFLKASRRFAQPGGRARLDKIAGELSRELLRKDRPPFHLTTIPTPHQLMKPGQAVEAFEKIKTRIDRIETDRIEALHQEVARLRDLQLLFESHPQSWAEFCQRRWLSNDSRKRPKINEPRDAALFLAYGLFDHIEDNRKRNKRVSRYKAALSELSARGIPPMTVVQTLREDGGISGLEKAWSARQKQARKDAGYNGIVTQEPQQAETGSKDRPVGKGLKRHGGEQQTTEPTPVDVGHAAKKPSPAKPSKSRVKHRVSLRSNRTAKMILSGETDKDQAFSVRLLRSGKRPLISISRIKDS